MQKSRLRPIILLPLLFLSSAAGAQTEEFQHLYAFPLSLMKEGDYYRAGTEFQRVYFQNRDKTREFGILKSAECYFLGGQYSDAIREISGREGSPYRKNFIWLKSFALARNRNYSAAVKTLGEENNEGSLYQIHLWNLSLAAEKNPQGSPPLWPQAWKSPVPGPEEPWNLPPVLMEEKYMAEWPGNRSKSPRLASAFSALLPGAGQWYNGEIGDAISSFLVTGLFISLTAAAAIQNEPILLGVSGTIAAVFYGGNIYGAWRGAGAHNERKKREFIDQLQYFSLRYRELQ